MSSTISRASEQLARRSVEHVRYCGTEEMCQFKLRTATAKLGPIQTIYQCLCALERFRIGSSLPERVVIHAQP